MTAGKAATVLRGLLVGLLQLPVRVRVRLVMKWHRLRLGWCGNGVMIYAGCRIANPNMVRIEMKQRIR